VNKSRVGYCQWYSSYFGKGNLLNKRVKFARDSKPAAVVTSNFAVDYGNNDRFFAKSTKLQDYYCDWRKNNEIEPVVDELPTFVHESA